MTDKERELMLLLAKKCIDLENRLLAIGSVLKAKRVISDSELDKAIKIGEETRGEYLQRAGRGSVGGSVEA